MGEINKRLLAEECLKIIQEIHKVATPEQVKAREENTELLDIFFTYERFMKKDLDELLKLSRELSAELHSIKSVSYTHLRAHET